MISPPAAPGNVSGTPVSLPGALTSVSVPVVLVLVNSCPTVSLIPPWSSPGGPRSPDLPVARFEPNPRVDLDQRVGAGNADGHANGVAEGGRRGRRGQARGLRAVAPLGGASGREQPLRLERVIDGIEAFAAWLISAVEG
jgi:hypothetical protein